MQEIVIIAVIIAYAFFARWALKHAWKMYVNGESFIDQMLLPTIIIAVVAVVAVVGAPTVVRAIGP